MIEMLKRPQGGATGEQIAAATGWPRQTISGALTKKLGLTVDATRSQEVGPNRRGAKGSSTAYRITGASRSSDRAVSHPHAWRRRELGGRMRIVAPDGSEIVPTTKPHPDGTLVKALARAWRG